MHECVGFTGEVVYPRLKTNLLCIGVTLNPHIVFNKRVVEGILAAKVVATKLGFQSTDINTLSDLHQAMRRKTSNDVTPEGMALIMEANLHGEPYSLEEIQTCIGYKVTQEARSRVTEWNAHCTR